jgi:hypothetical protein
MIHETIVATCNEDGTAHLAPMGMQSARDGVIIAPFRPSRTLDNLLRSGQAVINLTDDVRIFAGCLTGRSAWPCRPARRVPGHVLEAALAHVEVEVVDREDDGTRPRFNCRRLHEETHRPFAGFNRAQAAVIEAAVLVSRLGMLPHDKVEREIGYLRIAVDKTAGDREREAWEWLMQKIRDHERMQQRDAASS